MSIRNLLGYNVLRDETDENADAGGGDRGDNVEDLDEEEVEAAGSGDKEKESDDKDDEKVEKKPAMVPQKRMKEAVDKERKAREAAEARAKESDEKLQESKRGVDVEKLNTEIEELEDKLDQAIADNKPELKKTLRKELRDKMQTLARAEAVALSAQATAIAVERVRYDALVERLEVAHPVMNPEHEDYDEEVVAEIVDMKEAYEAKGLSSSDALKKAAKYVIKEVKKEEKAEEKAEEKEEEVEESKEAQDRREKQVIKAQAAKAKQPASPDKAGKASDKAGGGMAKNVDKLSDAEFDALDAKEVARLRGDSV